MSDATRQKLADINPDIRLHGIYRGTVVNAHGDPLNRGRIQIRIFGIHTAKINQMEQEGIPDEQLPWAEQVAPSMGGSSGFGGFSVPSPGSIVWCFFADGDPLRPMYFGVQMGMTASGGGGGGSDTRSGESSSNSSSNESAPVDVGEVAKNICEVAQKHNIDPCLVKALSDVESGGKSGVNSDGTSFIRYEPHVFAREVAGMSNGKSSAAYRTSKCQQIAQTNPALVAPSLTNPSTGKYYNNYNSQTKNHEFLSAAMTIDKEAAMKSCSWGKYQMMGFNYKSLGYSSVEEMAAAASDVNRQEELLDRFISSKSSLKSALQNKNFNNIAYYYNGSGAVGEYSPKLNSAYNKCKANNSINCSVDNSSSEGNSQNTGAISVNII